MQRLRSHSTLNTGWLLSSFCLLLGCDDAITSRYVRQLFVGEEQTKLERPQGPYQATVGIVAERAEVYEEPRASSRVIGTAVAGTLVPRSDAPVGREGCSEGWYAIMPRGYLCMNAKTTLDENHPTLKARAMSVNTENVLPYPYAVTRRDATLYEPDPKHADGVRERRKIPKGSVFAVVGSWNTLDEFDQRQRLAMLTSGQFVSVSDIEPLKFPKSIAILLGNSQSKLPLAFVIATKSEADSSPERGQPIELTGTSRVIDGERHWTRANGGTVRDRDVVVVRKRQEFPKFIGENTHFADLDLDHGALVLYEGKTPTYVTLALRLPQIKPRAGTGYVQKKQVTVPNPSTPDPAETEGERRDLAWVIELDSGLILRAATGRHRFVEPSPSNAIELHPDDARRLFLWLSPELPEKWHGVVVSEPGREGSPILLH